MVKELHEKADYYIDLHSGDDYEELTSYVYYAGRADVRTVEISRHMAQQVDVPYMVQSDVVSGGAYNYAASQGNSKCASGKRGNGMLGCRRGAFHEEGCTHHFAVPWNL